MEIYKMLALLLTNESPLIDQLGTCIAKDFVSIYNFISNIVTIHQSIILSKKKNRKNIGIEWGLIKAPLQSIPINNSSYTSNQKNVKMENLQ